MDMQSRNGWHQCTQEADANLHEREAREAGEQARKKFLEQHPEFESRAQPIIENLVDKAPPPLDVNHRRRRLAHMMFNDGPEFFANHLGGLDMLREREAMLLRHHQQNHPLLRNPEREIRQRRIENSIDSVLRDIQLNQNPNPMPVPVSVPALMPTLMPVQSERRVEDVLQTEFERIGSRASDADFEFLPPTSSIEAQKRSRMEFFSHPSEIPSSRSLKAEAASSRSLKVEEPTRKSPFHIYKNDDGQEFDIGFKQFLKEPPTSDLFGSSSNSNASGSSSNSKASGSSELPGSSSVFKISRSSNFSGSSPSIAAIPNDHIRPCFAGDLRNFENREAAVAWVETAGNSDAQMKFNVNPEQIKRNLSEMDPEMGERKSASNQNPNLVLKIGREPLGQWRSGFKHSPDPFEIEENLIEKEKICRRRRRFAVDPNPLEFDQNSLDFDQVRSFAVNSPLEFDQNPLNFDRNPFNFDQNPLTFKQILQNQTSPIPVKKSKSLETSVEKSMAPVPNQCRLAPIQSTWPSCSTSALPDLNGTQFQILPSFSYDGSIPRPILKSSETEGKPEINSMESFPKAPPATQSPPPTTQQQNPIVIPPLRLNPSGAVPYAPNQYNPISEPNSSPNPYSSIPRPNSRTNSMDAANAITISDGMLFLFFFFS